MQKPIDSGKLVSMDFPIVDLLDDELSEIWLTKYFHLNGLRCPHCSTEVKGAREFRQTRKSHLTVYRCDNCSGVYNLYSGTLFEASHLRPAQAILLLRGVCQGRSSAQIGREIGITRQTIMSIRRKIQSNAKSCQPKTPLTDSTTETDEMFQNAGEKSDPHEDPNDPPRRRANKKKGMGLMKMTVPQS